MASRRSTFPIRSSIFLLNRIIRPKQGTINSRATLHECPIRVLLMLLTTMIEEHYDQFSSCLFLLLSLLLTRFLSHSSRSDAVKKKRNFLPSVALSCSSRFCNAFSSALLSLSLPFSRLLIVGVFKSLFIALLIARAYRRLQTQCAKANNDQVKHMHSQHNVIISVN